MIDHSLGCRVTISIINSFQVWMRTIQSDIITIFRIGRFYISKNGRDLKNGLSLKISLSTATSRWDCIATYTTRLIITIILYPHNCMALVSSLALSHFTKWKVNIQANLVIYYTIHISKLYYCISLQDFSDGSVKFCKLCLKFKIHVGKIYEYLKISRRYYVIEHLNWFISSNRVLELSNGSFLLSRKIKFDSWVVWNLIFTAIPWTDGINEKQYY